MRKLTPSERKILDRLIYPEPFEVIQEETELAYGEIRDDIINLMNSRLIEVVDPEGLKTNSITAFDSDNIKRSTYRITKSGINHMKKKRMKFQATIRENEHDIELSPKEGTFASGDNEGKYTFEFVNGRHILRTGTKTYKIDNVSKEGSTIEFSMNGVWHSVDVKDEQELLLDRLGFKTGAAAAEGILKAPMPGKILEIMVAEGDEVEKDQPLAILEAMKMENELKAPVSGTIASISAEIGQSLEKIHPYWRSTPLDKFIIKGGNTLKGTIPISGSKNAALPLMAASLLGNSASTIRNIPRLKDIYTFNNVIRVVGAHVDFKEDENTLIIDPTHINHLEAPYDLVRKMRASFYMLGALVGKHGYAKVSLPGGCAWGPRPVDLHLKGMEAMGIDISLEKGYVIAKADDKVEGGTFTLEPSSVGATVNLVLAAVLKAKKFTIKNAAKEPDVVQLCNFLVKMGADIEGIGTSTITVKAVDQLQGIEVSNDPDRIELGTFMIAGAMFPGSELTLTGCNPDHLGNFPDKLRKTGTSVEIDGTIITVKAPDTLKPVSIKTEIYPGFPTDLQAQWATMMTQAEGDSKVTDTVYFDRFSYVPELVRLGADMDVEKNTVHISGKTQLTGASVMSTDLRASVSLVLAALVAENSSEVLRIYHLDRGYESLEEKLTAVGADIKRVDEE